MRRSGFTLLEMILALALSMVLVSAMVSATSLYWRFRSESFNRVQPAQTLEGIMQDIGSDLRSVLSPSLPTDVSRRAAASDGTSFLNVGSSIGERVLNIESQNQGEPIRLVGSESALLIARSGVNERFSPPRTYRRERTSQVLWLSPSVSSVRLPVARRNSQITEQSFARPSNVVGLVRFELTRDTSGRSTRSQDRNYESIAEVERLAFRYFDGSLWLSSWNSDARNGQLPTGVAIQLQLVNSASSYRFVVALPTADSPAPSAIQQRVLETIRSQGSPSEPSR